MTRSTQLAALLAVILTQLTGGSSRAAGPERTLVEWTFDRELQGWAPNGDLADVRVAGGALNCRAVGGDPIIELRTRLDVPATPWQVIEVRLRADRDGTAEFFWSNTNAGRYGGFEQAKTTRFQVAGDGQWHVYRLLPFWHREGKIVRLRFDLYDGATFAIDSIRLVELTMPPAAAQPRFDFTRDGQGWQPVAGATLESRGGGAVVTTAPADSFVLAPPLKIAAEAGGYLALRMAVDRGRTGTLYFATDGAYGLHSLAFPIEPDGRERTYNIDMMAARDWRGRVVALGLRPSDAPDARATLRGLAVAEEPQGPPQLKVVTFAPEDALPRAGVPTTLVATVTNTGGQPATNVQATLTLPPGATALDAAPAVASIEFGEPAIFKWHVQATAPLAGEAVVHVSSNANRAGTRPEPASATARLVFTARLALAPTDYVPEPKPVRGPFEVGVYYFPGWNNASRWEPITRFPERRPVLGWYREGDPELADWQIKWAVEHGITFFAYDWYWSRGNRQLEHGLHDGYFKARYHHLLKFCLLWANHNAPGTSSRDDCLAVTRYWIENYFRRPEHLTVAGKPAVIIFSPQRLSEDLGSAGVKAAFEAMRAECRKAGLKGLHLIACVGDAGGARQAAAEGYDAVTAYNWPGLGMPAGSGMRAPFEMLLPGYRRQWEHIIDQSPIPLSPLPVCGGWDSRPWHGENNLIRFGRTPELFRRHLLDARSVLEASGRRGDAGNLILIEAWNEWGEGSYIEPHQEYGFGFLDAIRDVFTPAPKAHDDVTPADVGRGPYDIPPEPPRRTSWNFEQGLDGWTSMMEMTTARAEGGALRARTTGRDPALASPVLQARAARFPTVTVRMKLQHTDGRPFRDTAQLFWQTGRWPESEASSAHFEVVGDGQWHDYRLPVSENRRWSGTVTHLRLDPCNQSDVEVEIDAIRLGP
jgi:uncharacterized repeat protein (TIGR01451 family)